VQESLEEKLCAGKCVDNNVDGQWNNIKKCLLNTMSDCVGKVEKRARKPWIAQEMISKMNSIFQHPVALKPLQNSLLTVKSQLFSL
jgi:hypothetical protein